LRCRLIGIRLIAIAIAACITACGAAPSETEDESGAIDCEPPWSSMDQVFECGASDYRLAGMEGDQIANIIVRSKDPAVIAAALAHAWNEHIPADEEAVVWAWSKRGAIGHGYDRGVLSEQGELGEKLVFQICTAWEPFPGPSDLCADEMEFTIEQ
jgi:hypothetical protein